MLFPFCIFGALGFNVFLHPYLWTGRQTDRQTDRQSKYDLQNGMTQNNLVVNHANTKLLQFTEKTLHPTKPDSQN